MFQPGPDWSGPPMAVLLNKTDLLTEQQVQELSDWYINNCRAEKVRSSTPMHYGQYQGQCYSVVATWSGLKHSHHSKTFSREWSVDLQGQHVSACGHAYQQQAHMVQQLCNASLMWACMCTSFAQGTAVHRCMLLLLVAVCLPQVFVGSALESSDGGVEAIKAWAVDKLPEGPTLYPKVW